MKLPLGTIERHARYAMSVVAILAVLAGIGLRAGLINKAPFYHDDHWYLESSRSSFVIISEHADEQQCRDQEKPFTSCRSGRSLIEEARVQKAAFNF